MGKTSQVGKGAGNFDSGRKKPVWGRSWAERALTHQKEKTRLHNTMRMQALLCTTIVSATKESLVYGLGSVMYWGWPPSSSRPRVAQSRRNDLRRQTNQRCAICRFPRGSQPVLVRVVRGACLRREERWSRLFVKLTSIQIRSVETFTGCSMLDILHHCVNSGAESSCSRWFLL